MPADLGLWFLMMIVVAFTAIVLLACGLIAIFTGRTSGRSGEPIVGEAGRERGQMFLAIAVLLVIGIAIAREMAARAIP